MSRPITEGAAVSPGCFRQRINCAGPALILLLFVGGLTTGWILRGFRDNDWRIGPPPVRWHPVTLLGVVEDRILLVKWGGEPTEVVPICEAKSRDSDMIGQDIHLPKQIADATAVMLDFGEEGAPEFDSQGRMRCRVWLHGKQVMPANNASSRSLNR